MGPLFASSRSALLSGVAALLFVISGCSAAESEPAPETDSATSVRADAGEASSFDVGERASSAVAADAYLRFDYDLEPVGDALRGDRSNSSFPPALVDLDEIRSGGPPPDGIPPLDEPDFIAVDDVEFLEDDEAVIVVRIDDDARAYPVQILIWHEIVNDVIAEVPVSVTYCPLCNSAVAYDRRYGSRILDFGTSGELYQSALVMYDRQTNSLWSHFTGQGLIGHYAGAELKAIPAPTISWAQFRDAYPAGQVLSLDTGFDRRYGANPYVGYDEETSNPIGAFFNGPVDDTLDPKVRVVGIHDAQGSIAVRLDDVAAQSAFPITEGDRNLVVFHQPGLASALQEGSISGGRDIGQTGVFIAESLAGMALTFEASDGDSNRTRLVDDQTGSTWNVLGQAIDGELAGERLTAVPHLDTFWFAWATYRPGSTLVGFS